jgi:hypothetical protein
MSQLGGEYVSVNVNCMDDVDPATLKAVYWDETYRKTRRREEGERVSRFKPILRTRYPHSADDGL